MANFLSLPIEIRRSIWNQILDEPEVHLGYNRSRLGSEIVAFTNKNQEFMTSPHHLGFTSCNNRHNEPNILMSILLICRQFRNEVEEVAYKNILFIFNKPQHLDHFIYHRSSVQMSSIRRISLVLEFTHRDATSALLWSSSSDSWNHLFRITGILDRIDRISLDIRIKFDTYAQALLWLDTHHCWDALIIEIMSIAPFIQKDIIVLVSGLVQKALNSTADFTCHPSILERSWDGFSSDITPIRPTKTRLSCINLAKLIGNSIGACYAGL